MLAAAGTERNIHKHTPGLVGGHGIPVNPYYLVYKARELGHHLPAILAGRVVSDYMPRHVAELAIKELNDAGLVIKGSKVLIMGLTYKENVPDTRESPAREMVKVLQEYSPDVYGYDSLLSREEIEGFGVKARGELDGAKPDCVILAVVHEQFKVLDEGELARAIKDCPVVVDVKGILRGSSCTL